MYLRVLLVILSVLLLFFVGWMATHVSSEPALFGRYSVTYFFLLIGILALLVAMLLAQLPAPYRRLYRVRHEIILVVSSLLVSLVVVEIALRMIDPLGISYFRESSKYHLDKIPDPHLIYKHAPNIRKTYQGVTVTTNDLGLRERILKKKQPDELRVLLLGDSITFGCGVPIEATFGRQLEVMLGSETGLHVKTINAGGWQLQHCAAA